MANEIQKTVFEQYGKVRSDETDGDDCGHEWAVHYILYRSQDDDGRACFDLYSDDGEGNGDLIARGHNETKMRSLLLRLGTFVEWASPPINHAVWAVINGQPVDIGS